MSTLATAAGFSVLGLLLGLAHFAWLRRDVQRYLAKGRRRFAILLYPVRIVASVAAWVGVAKLGGPAGLLGAFVGFLVARTIVTARSSRGSQ